MRSNKLNCYAPGSAQMLDTICEHWHKFMDGEPPSQQEFYAESYDDQCAFYYWFIKQHNDTFIIGI